MEPVVSDAIVVLERRDVLWAEIMFPAAEIRALEEPCREQRGAPAHQGPEHHALAVPTWCREQRPDSRPSPDTNALGGLRPVALLPWDSHSFKP